MKPRLTGRLASPRSYYETGRGIIKGTDIRRLPTTLQGCYNRAQMELSLMLAQMCHQTLSRADINAIRKARGLEKEVSSASSLEAFFLTSVGMKQAVSTLSEVEIAGLYLLLLVKEDVDIKTDDFITAVPVETLGSQVPAQDPAIQIRSNNSVVDLLQDLRAQKQFSLGRLNGHLNLRYVFFKARHGRRLARITSAFPDFFRHSSIF